MAEPNDQLCGAREQVDSPSATGACLSRQELAELVNTWVFEHTEDHRVIELDASYVAKLDRMGAAIANRPEGRTRNQTRLASLIMTIGDPLEAAALGNQALNGAGLLRSQRAAHDLRELRRLSQPHTHLPEIAELRHRIGTILAA